MITDDAVITHLYKRSEVFFLPLCFFQQAAAQCGGEFVPREDWSQVLFLCSDAIAVSFWLKRPNEEPTHTLASVELSDITRDIPELVDLWVWKHLAETWDEIRANFVGSSDVSEYARNLALTYPQCLISRNVGLN